jgi:hypothetical protein
MDINKIAEKLMPLDSNFIQLNKLQLLFRPSRKYTASSHSFMSTPL